MAARNQKFCTLTSSKSDIAARDLIGTDKKCSPLWSNGGGNGVSGGEEKLWVTTTTAGRSFRQFENSDHAYIDIPY
jgi:hypothetical protein